MVHIKEFLTTLKKGVYFLAAFTLLYIFFVFANNLDNEYSLGLISNDGIILFYQALSMFLAGLIAIPWLRHRFSKYFIIDKTKWKKAVILPIVAAAILAFITSLVRYIPYHYFDYSIQVGSDQVTSLLGVSAIGAFISKSVVAPFSEEFLFRFLPYVFLVLLSSELADMAKNSQRISKVYHKVFDIKKTYVIFSWLLLTSFWFAMAHGPALDVFPFYFIHGSLFGLFFIRYGFLSAWLLHGALNFFSNYTFLLFFG